MLFRSGTWSSKGYPHYLDTDNKITIPGDVLTIINTTLKEGGTCPKQYRQAIDFEINDPEGRNAEVSIRIIGGTSGAASAFGYYCYRADASLSEIKKAPKCIVFPNTLMDNYYNKKASGLQGGESVKLHYIDPDGVDQGTVFPNGVKIGWFLLNDSFYGGNNKPFYSTTKLNGDDTPFVMELPPYRMPTSKAIFRHTWEKGAQYLRKMGGIIMVASIVIWALGYYPNHDEYESVTEQQENSYIGRIGKAMEPVIEPLGFDWKLGIGILSGVGAKELVVSTLGVLYADDAEADAVSLSERIPITPLVAFGYMVFVLIYFPCIATLAAIKGESGSWKWAVFAGLYTTALAWLMSFAIYQIGGLFL